MCGGLRVDTPHSIGSDRFEIGWDVAVVSERLGGLQRMVADRRVLHAHRPRTRSVPCALADATQRRPPHVQHVRLVCVAHAVRPPHCDSAPAGRLRANFRVCSKLGGCTLATQRPPKQPLMTPTTQLYVPPASALHTTLLSNDEGARTLSMQGSACCYIHHLHPSLSSWSVYSRLA
jgi:hypothetical protein